MSTKIYNAYLFNGGYDEILPLVKKLRNVSTEKLKNEVSKKIIMNSQILVKHFPWIGEDKKISSLEWLDVSRVLCDIFKSDSLIDFYDFNAPSCVIYLVDGKIAFQFFQLYKEVENLIQSDPRFTDYHYQNSTDQSNYNWRKEKWEEMSEDRKNELVRDWDDREIFWDKVFDSVSTPLDSGLTYNFYPWNFTEICMEVMRKDIIRDKKIDHINEN